jgi:cell division protein FtsQ
MVTTIAATNTALDRACGQKGRRVRLMDDRGRLPSSPTRVPNPRRAGRAIHRLLFAIESRRPRGAGVLAASALLLATLSYGVVKGGHTDWVGAQFGEIRDGIANTIGFRIDSIALTGQKQLTREEILGIAGVTGRSSLLFLNADDARARLKANPWIADATVLKLFPDRLHIAITERRAFALWQKDGRVRVVARDGVVVEPFVAPHVAHLPLVVGNGANVKAADFLSVMDRYPQLQEQVHAYVLVAERRWNLRLKNGVDIRLPEAGPAQAIETVIALDREQKLLSRDIAAIDLRNADRVAVRLSDAAAAARAEAIKAKTQKRKGGDA